MAAPTPAPAKPKAAETPAQAKSSILEILMEPHFDLKGARPELTRLHGAFSAGEGGIPEPVMKQWVHQFFRDRDTFFINIGRAWEREM